MDPKRALEAFRDLAATSPKWVGSRVDRDRNVIIRACMRCGGQVEKAMPKDVVLLRGRDRVVANVPPGFDDELFDWLKAFATAHRGCPENARPNEG